MTSPCCVCYAERGYQTFFFLRAPINPAKPAPMRSMVAGSGTLLPPPLLPPPPPRYWPRPATPITAIRHFDIRIAVLEVWNEDWQVRRRIGALIGGNAERYDAACMVDPVVFRMQPPGIAPHIGVRQSNRASRLAEKVVSRPGHLVLPRRVGGIAHSYPHGVVIIPPSLYTVLGD